MMLSQVIALAFAASAAAFSITTPGPNTWWVANSKNTVGWSPCDGPAQQSMPGLNVVVSNSNQTALPGNFTILGNVPTYDCSVLVDVTELPPSPSYTMYLTLATNTNDVLAMTQFEVKQAGSSFPTSSVSASSTATVTGSSANATASTTPSGASAASVLNLQGLLATVVGVGAILGFV